MGQVRGFHQMPWTYPDSVDGIGLGLASWFNLAESVLPRLA